MGTSIHIIIIIIIIITSAIFSHLQGEFSHEGNCVLVSIHIIIKYTV